MHKMLQQYNAVNVYRRELAPRTVSLTGDRAQGDDSKHWANSRCLLVHEYTHMYGKASGLWKIVSEYDQEIQQSQTADKPMASWGRAKQHPRDARKTNKVKQPALSSPWVCLQFVIVVFPDHVSINKVCLPFFVQSANRSMTVDELYMQYAWTKS